jgi:hypothetical protein
LIVVYDEPPWAEPIDVDSSEQIALEIREGLVFLKKIVSCPLLRLRYGSLSSTLVPTRRVFRRRLVVGEANWPAWLRSPPKQRMQSSLRTIEDLNRQLPQSYAV